MIVESSAEIRCSTIIANWRSSILKVSSPKIQTASKGQSIYPYYAGFDEGFVQSWLELVNPGPFDVVADPWNGSGTTTTVCGRNGVQCMGIDINPFMRAVSSARVATRSDWSELVDLLAVETFRFPKRPMPLIAAAQYLFGRIVGNKQKSEKSYWLVLFLIGASLKNHSTAAKSKNPTWFSYKRVNEIETAVRALYESTYSMAIDMRESTARVEDSGAKRPILITGNAATFKAETPVKFVLTSPPYLTRIDYVQKTLPETLFALSVLGGDLKDLRISMLGSVLTTSVEKVDTTVFPDYVQSVLDTVRNHSSKASATYYLNFFVKYFVELSSSLRNIAGQVESGGSITMVTQGSYYKEVFLDLPQVVEVFMEMLGWKLVSQASFNGPNSLAQVNKRAFASTQSPPQEVVQIFGNSL